MIVAAINWETVYKQYEPKVRAYIQSRVGNPDDVNDICSDVFFSIISKKEQFSGEQKAISSWIYMITKHTVAGFYRSHRISEEIPEGMADDTDIEDITMNAENLELLADGLEQLDQKLRDIIILHYYGEKKLKDIATAMGMSYSNIKILHKKALDKLRTLMQ